jgi:hypothetical protein
LRVGTTDTHVVLRAGDWALYLAIQSEARFPKMDQIVREAYFAGTIDPIEGFLATSVLGRLCCKSRRRLAEAVLAVLNCDVGIPIGALWLELRL